MQRRMEVQQLSTVTTDMDPVSESESELGAGLILMNESFTVSDEYVNVSSSSSFELSSPIHPISPERSM